MVAINFAFSVPFPLVVVMRRVCASTRRAEVCRSRSLDPECGGVDRNAPSHIANLADWRSLAVPILVHSARTCALRDCFLFRLCSKIAANKLIHIS